MVLQPNFAKRADSENTPPVAPHLVAGKAIASQVRSTLQEASRRRRARANGVPRTSKNKVEQAKKRSTAKTPAPSATFRFNVISAPGTPDIEMQDVTPSPSTQVTLPRYLGRPDYREISQEALIAADSEDTNISFLRQGLEEFGPSMLRVLGSVRASPMKNTLPTEIPIVVNDTTAPLPTHMMAIYGPPPQNGSTEKRKITLYPVHSTVLAAYCSKLPPFRPTSEAVRSATPEHSVREVTIPVRPICLPSAQTYPQLSSFLYTKRTDALLASMMPCLPPQSLAEQSEITAFATRLAGTYTIQALLQHAMTVHGLWGNVCALGIFDDALWETIDLAWQVLLTAIAIGTGNPQAMIPPTSA